MKSLERVSKTTTMHFSLEKSDTERRSKLIQQSWDGTIDNVVKVDTKINGDFFWNIEFFATTEKEKPYPDAPVSMRCSNNTQINKSSKKIRTRTHHVRLVGFDGWIIIRISKIKGKIPSDEFISGSSMYPSWWKPR